MESYQLKNNKIKPILKWVGDKITKKRITNYYEPFIGGGAILLALLQSDITIDNFYAYDINKPLIFLYKNIQSDYNKFYDELKVLIDEYKKEGDQSLCYYIVRNKYNQMTQEEQCSFQGSSMFLFLNKTCFRGIFRVNKKGIFNVPFGNYKQPQIVNKEHLQQFSQLIQKVQFQHMDFQISFSQIIDDENNFIYMDSPYVQQNQQSFVDYDQTNKFDIDYHKLLFKLCLDFKYINFLMSNSDNELLKQTFQNNKYKIEIIQAKRKINSKKPQDTCQEILLINY